MKEKVCQYYHFRTILTFFYGSPFRNLDVPTQTGTDRRPAQDKLKPDLPFEREHDMAEEPNIDKL